MITGKASCSSLLQANLSSLCKIILERMKDYLGDKLNIEQADGISKRNFARGILLWADCFTEDYCGVDLGMEYWATSVLRRLDLEVLGKILQHYRIPEKIMRMIRTWTLWTTWFCRARGSPTCVRSSRHCKNKPPGSGLSKMQPKPRRRGFGP